MNVVDDKNQELCKALWLEHEPKLRKFCKHKMQSCPNEVDDVIADTFLSLWKAIDSDDLPKNPRAWLYTVAYNLIKQKYTEMNKLKARVISLDTLNEEVFELSVGFDIDEERIPDSLIEKLSYQIEDSLKPDEKQLLNLIYEEHLKMKEIAKILNITEQAVKQRNYRMNRKIKMMAKEYIEKV